MSEMERLDWLRLADEFYQAGYDGRSVLETGSPSGNLVEDTKKNLDYLRKTFRMPA